MSGVGLASAGELPDLFPGQTPPLLPSDTPDPTSAFESSTTSSTTSSLPQDTSSTASTDTQLTNSSNTSILSANRGSSGDAFFKNKPQVIGVFVGAGVLVILVLACIMAGLLRRRRRQKQSRLDREIDVSYKETMAQASKEWQRSPSIKDPRITDLHKTQSIQSSFSDASGTHAGYYNQQPLALVQEQEQSFYAYHHRGHRRTDSYGDAFGLPQPPPQRRDSDGMVDVDLGTGSAPGVVSMAVRGVVVEPQVQVIQPQRAKLVKTVRPPMQNVRSQYAHPPPQAAQILVHPSATPTPPPYHPAQSPPPPQQQALPALYLSHYAVTPFTEDAVVVTSPKEMPLTPTVFPNPFEAGQQQPGNAGDNTRLTPSAAMPVSPGLPNPFSPGAPPKAYSKRMTLTVEAAAMPVSPTPSLNLPNPYGGME
ncbi:hypothetical protein R3P38DRAFT_2844584 [Favolaschia claudopus]|uniref:Transmembrane protein n=1 Tax=Favolaschia claudopus TaxID=2862362 RepID=A0AAW0E465_9AGAR